MNDMKDMLYLGLAVLLMYYGVPYLKTGKDIITAGVTGWENINKAVYENGQAVGTAINKYVIQPINTVNQAVYDSGYQTGENIKVATNPQTYITAVTETIPNRLIALPNTFNAHLLSIFDRLTFWD